VNGLTFVFSGDTAKPVLHRERTGADLLIHECFNTVKQLIGALGL
jgi:ribonuclease BN (tRNA processing enzyme)